MREECIVVGIPTFRRPHLLAQLLASLRAEIGERDVLVVIGDNAAGDETGHQVGTDVADVAAASGLTATCIPVITPGIAQVRNALIRAATARRPGWTHLIMLDDDGFVTPGWFDALRAAVEDHDADVTAGPVLGDLPEGASILARNSVYAGRTRFPTGPVDMLTGAQNICVARRILDRIGDPWFPTELGSSGGEDYYFFRAVLHAGGRLAWADTAEVVEPTPMARLRTSALVTRAFHSNVVGAQTDRAFLGSRYVTRRLVGGVGMAARNTAAAVARRDRDRLTRTGLDVVSLAGRATGLVRRRPTDIDHRSF